MATVSAAHLSPCGRAITRTLAKEGRWMSRCELSHGLQWHETVVNDTLADLVAAGALLFNIRTREYRSPGGPMGRKALSQLLADPDPALQRVALMTELRADPARHLPRRFVVGLAQHTTTADGQPLTVSAEIEIPHPGSFAAVLDLARHVAAFTDIPNTTAPTSQHHAQP